MGYLKKLLLVLPILVFILSVCNCTTAVEDNPCEDPNLPTNRSVNPKTVYFRVMADQYLQEENKLAILAAINEWAEKTHFTVKYSLEFIDMSTVVDDFKAVETIHIYVRDPGPGYVGWAEWVGHNDNKISAHILIKPGMDSNSFRKIMLHELGHVFGLTFKNPNDQNPLHYLGPCESVMHPSIGESSEHLECPELQTFCSIHGCNVDCDNKTTSNQGEMSGAIQTSAEEVIQLSESSR